MLLSLIVIATPAPPDALHRRERDTARFAPISVISDDSSRSVPL